MHKRQLEGIPFVTARELIEKKHMFSEVSKRWVAVNIVIRLLNSGLRSFWSDKAIFTVTCNCDGHVFCPRGSDSLDPRYTCGTKKYPDSPMGWWCFTVHCGGEHSGPPKPVFELAIV